MGIPIKKYVSGLLGGASAVASVAKVPIRMAIGKAAIASTAALAAGAVGAGGATYATRKYYKRKQKKEQSNGSNN